MNNFGLIVTINGFNKSFYNYNKTFICNNLNDAKNKLVNYLALELNKLNIDYPLNFEDLDRYWFNDEYVKAQIFSYQLFNNSNWSEPWDYQDLYDEILEIMNNYEIEHVPDFTKLFSENDESIIDKPNNIKLNKQDDDEITEQDEIKEKDKIKEHDEIIIANITDNDIDEEKYTSLLSNEEKKFLNIMKKTISKS